MKFVNVFVSFSPKIYIVYVKGALSAEEIQEVLELDKIKTHHWKIVWCSAVTGENLLDGMDWLLNDISARIFTLD